MRRNLRAEIDSLENRVKWINIAGMPVVVIVAGFGSRNDEAQAHSLMKGKQLAIILVLVVADRRPRALLESPPFGRVEQHRHFFQ